MPLPSDYTIEAPYDYATADPYSPFFEPAVSAPSIMPSTYPVAEPQRGIGTPVGGAVGEKDTGFGYDWSTPWTAKPTTPEAAPAPGFAVAPSRITGTTTTQITRPIMPTGPRPTLALTPWSEKEAMKRRGIHMGPPLRRAERGLQRTVAALPTAAEAGNIMVAREYARAAVEEHGMAVSDIAYKAGRLSREDYMRELEIKHREELANFEGAWKEFLAQIGQETTAETTYRYGGAGAGTPTEAGNDFVTSYQTGIKYKASEMPGRIYA